MEQNRWLETKSADQNGFQPWKFPEPAWKWQTDTDRLAALTENFTPIELEEMVSVALLNRKDTKFVMSTGQLMHAIMTLKNDYRMLTVDGRRLNHYRSLYFDTPDFKFYHRHVNGRADRYKVRSREYTDTHLSFLEVKHKTNRDFTIKERLHTERPVVEINGDCTDWLSSMVPGDTSSLQAKIWNTFTRITLVSVTSCERVTLDIDITFYKDDGMIHLDDIAIAEVKYDALHRGSAFMQQMHTLRIQRNGFSKYCFGVAMLYDQVKKNAIKEKMLLLNKITEGNVRHV